MDLPLIAPDPPRLSRPGDALERSGESSDGPEVRAFEAEATARLFGGRGGCLAVADATLGLMLAIRDALGPVPHPGPGGARFALMPALTFAATAQAALWAGCTPLVCDVDPDGWHADPAEEERLLRLHGDRVAVLTPYATFGAAIDLDRYAWLRRRFGVGVVVDAASSLGTLDEAGVGFGAGAPFAVVHSMHATKTFAVAEGGLVHSGDAGLVERLRRMANFGLDDDRNAVGPGLNAKLAEVLAVAARAKLAELDRLCDARAAVEAAYRGALAGAGFGFQAAAGRRRAIQFMSVTLPRALAPRRGAVTEAMAAAGVGAGRHFSPHLGEQPWVRANALVEPTPVADDLGARLLSLPVTDAMTPDDARRAADALVAACEVQLRTPPRPAPARPKGPAVAGALVVGGGPAGTALLTAASRAGRLEELARVVLVLVERGAGVGDGRLGRYAITSDSTARTFLSAVEGHPSAALAALADHPAARAVGRRRDALGVPLGDVGALLRATGGVLADAVRAAGGEVLTGHEAVSAHREGDLWRVALNRPSDGTRTERLARRLVLATGGHQPLDRLAAQIVAGAPLAELAAGRLMQSDELLMCGGHQRAADLLAGRRAPRVAVVGGSTSALASVALLLRGPPALPLGAGGVTLLHRRPLRPFYQSAEAALAEGFTDFGPDDVCPVSGFVYRLAGFRLEARELVLRMLGVDGREPDPRVALHQITGDDAPAREIIERAHLVVAALGYRPHALPLFDGRRPLALAAAQGRPMVDRHCRVLDADDRPLPGVYGIGLAAGFTPWGLMGGERSFSGQANGLWLWQNDVGAMIVDQLLGAAARAVA